MDRREFLAVSGTALTGAATTYLTAPRLDAALSGDRIGDGLMTQIEASLPALRDTDHRHGGQHAMTYVHGQWLTIAALIRDGHHRDTVTARLLAAFAELGDLAGYMAFDSGQHGLAQRYWLTALRAAHHATTRPLAASILGNLSYQAASRGYHTDAVTLAEAAARAARVAPAAVRVSSASRLATAHAAAGDVAGFRAAQHQSEDLFATGETRWPAPDWADFVSSSFLASQGAYALIRLGSTSLDSNRRTGRRLLAQGQDLLRPSLAPYRGEYQRSAVIRAAWLARAYLASGEIEEACSVGRVAMTRLTAVDSPRCRAPLTSLHTALRCGGRRHNQTVREFTAHQAPTLRAESWTLQCWRRCRLGRATWSRTFRLGRSVSRGCLLR